MKRYTILIGLLFVVLLSCDKAQKATQESSFIDKTSIPVIEDFFKKVQTGEYKTAVDYLLKGNENIDLADSLTGVLRSKFEHLNENSGSFISKRLMRKKVLEDDLAVYSYIAKYEKKCYRFTFVFYNNEKAIKI